MSQHLFAEPSFISASTTQLLDETLELTAFITRKLKQLNASVQTAEDAKERDEAISRMCLLQSALSLLNLAYFSESSRVIEDVKMLLREIQR